MRLFIMVSAHPRDLGRWVVLLEAAARRLGLKPEDLVRVSVEDKLFGVYGKAKTETE
jgi:hypothetical protein